MNTFSLCRSSLANQSPGGASGGLAGAEYKNIQNRIQKHFPQSHVSVVRETTERMLHYLEKLLACRNHHGLLAEHLDLRSNEQWGNFVQTYSMVGLINAAIRLSIRWDQAF